MASKPFYSASLTLKAQFWLLFYLSISCCGQLILQVVLITNSCSEQGSNVQKTPLSYSEVLTLLSYSVS